MKYLTARQILLIHSMVIDETGGSHGVRSRDAVLSLVSAPKQKVFDTELYPDVFSKASVLAHNIIKFHPFVDGNKRTGMAAAAVFLADNGYELSAKDGEIEKLALAIIKNKLDLDRIAKWFRRNATKAKGGTSHLARLGANTA